MRHRTLIRAAPVPSNPDPFVVKCLSPLITHSSPSRRAEVWTPVEGSLESKFAPPDVSVKAHAARSGSLPAKEGKNWAFCSGVPKWMIGWSPKRVPRSAVGTLISTRVSSSAAKAKLSEGIAVPPYSTGTSALKKPAFTIS